MTKSSQMIHIEHIFNAGRQLHRHFNTTPLHRNDWLSERYGCNVYLKREDLQVVRSFKIRGAYHAIQSLTDSEQSKGVACASAGNHAQGVAYSCKLLGIKGWIFMPHTTPRQKIRQVERFGGSLVEVILTGDTFDDAYAEAMKFVEQEGIVFIHPFDDEKTIIGQGTIGMELMNQMNEPIHHLFSSIGGGGLISGVGSFVKTISPRTKIIGVEPSGAASMKQSLDSGEIIALDHIDKFVDGAAVKQVGKLPFQICKEILDDVVLVPEGKACTTILELYNNSAIVLEPAGAMPISALDFYKEEIRGQNVVCILSGGNNDIDRMQEMKERSMIYEGLKHYFVVNFPQRSGALREFLDDVLGPDDDITRFEYTKKTNRDNGPALVGIELKQREDYDGLVQRMEEKKYTFVNLNGDPQLFNLLV